jgi:hypothetical protein
MKASASSRGGASFVPPEQVMTRLMAGEDERRAHLLDYLVMAIVVGGMMLGILLSGRF